MNKELLIKYLNNKCSSSEVDETMQWFRKEADSITNHRMVREVWHELSPVDNHYGDARFERILDKIHHQINLKNSEKQKKLKNLHNLLHKTGNIIMRAAAVLFLPLLLTFLYTLHTQRTEFDKAAYNGSENIEVISPVGSRTYIELPDGTGVHLNHGSRLSYPRRFGSQERKVDLAGEAYFSITHNPDKPFRVYAGKISVTAIGTEFNVMAYPGQPKIETTLVEGKVIFQKATASKESSVGREMLPGDHLSYSAKTGNYTCKKADVQKYISWKDGMLIFKDDPLEEIALRLGRWYNVDFVFKNSSVKNMPYTATFVDETLVQIMDLLQLATPIRYEITPRVKQPDGTFSKQKIIIDSK
jgi:ferric-dicitrate binding protein FerR (iron transport regulator)